MHHDIGHVAVYEHLSGKQTDNLIGRHARVGTADPEVVRSLQIGQLLKKSGSTSRI